MQKKTVVVTGASTGIGHATVAVLVERGYQVFGTVRQQADAERLQAEFRTSFRPLHMDVTDQAAILRASEEVRLSLGQAKLAGLVNNAGISVVGPLLHQPVEDFRRQLEVNLISPMLVTQAFAKLLGSDRTREGASGRIINISSVGGRMGAPFLGAYAASKHGLEGMTESLRRELMLYGIDVVLIEPGYVNTPILDKAEADDFGVYRDTDYGPVLLRFAKYFITEGRKGLPPRAIGEAVYKALTVRKPKVVYTVVQQKFKNWTLPMLLPRRTLDRLIGKQTGAVSFTCLGCCARWRFSTCRCRADPLYVVVRRTLWRRCMPFSSTKGSVLSSHKPGFARNSKRTSASMFRPCTAELPLPPPGAHCVTGRS